MSACVKTCANLTLPAKNIQADLLTQRTEVCLSTVQKDNTHCPFSTFAVMNMQSGAFQPQCAKYTEEKMQICYLAHAL